MPGAHDSLRLNGRRLAIVLAALAVLGLVGAAVGFVTDVFVAPGRLLTADGEESIHFGASLIALVGALWMYQGREAGRRLVLLSLALNILATLFLSFRRLGDPATIAVLIAWAALCYLTLAARLPTPSGFR